MRWIAGLSKAQRVVAVIAFGLALGTLGSYLVNIGDGLASGWYAYSPLTSTLYAPTGFHPWLRLLIWLALIGVWMLGSIRMLQAPPGAASPLEPESRSGSG
jgi:hypothetical protein